MGRQRLRHPPSLSEVSGHKPRVLDAYETGRRHCCQGLCSICYHTLFTGEIEIPFYRGCIIINIIIIVFGWFFFSWLYHHRYHYYSLVIFMSIFMRRNKVHQGAKLLFFIKGHRKNGI